MTNFDDKYEHVAEARILIRDTDGNPMLQRDEAFLNRAMDEVENAIGKSGARCAWEFAADDLIGIVPFGHRISVKYTDGALLRQIERQVASALSAAISRCGHTAVSVSFPTGTCSSAEAVALTRHQLLGLLQAQKVRHMLYW